MLAQLRNALIALFGLTLLTGVLYPLVVTGVAKLAFARQAEGSLVLANLADKKVVGSRLVGQPFDDPKYLWGRLSATSSFAYNASASSGSNLGPTNSALFAAVEARVKALREVDPANAAAIPIDLVTSSGSGLDPHISPLAARYQASRIARARGIEVARVQALIDAHTEQPTFGILGEARVNVLEVNLAIDQEIVHPRRPEPHPLPSRVE